VDLLELSPKPIISAIHGTALGGGLEIALACHYRLALSSSSVGLPEVALGILPGAGGTQRLPRLVSLEKALEIIVSGQHVKAPAALSLGILDKVIQDTEKVKGSFFLYPPSCSPSLSLVSPP
jgi:enoyl-CoA hydratase/carnithine racemase